MIVVPFIALKGAEFGGSDDAGSQMVNEVTGKEYTPWFTPILENFIGGEIPGEIDRDGYGKFCCAGTPCNRFYRKGER